ncbi:hypothetical protein BGZ61DRAFT_469349 [Ilyonectria robusta]|uniref:uncharacterized protein n=1 Tax=Ilyonectria robusta TaxID=1079257 RepID=UPI001E8EEA76|nr:uncharacterized protein BGZ61DRAFT_469349 [Ilyonectria robusta]KAH8650438.1 hypothetical protein BGZ61DRAFT_469349 [Ilyonectria robusta]
MSTSQSFPTASTPSTLLEAASFPDDCLPPEAEYQSRDELITGIQHEVSNLISVNIIFF